MTIKKTLARGVLLFALLFTCNNILLAQDTVYWFVAPHNSEQVAAGVPLNRPVFLAISNPNSTEAKVQITINNGGSPLVYNEIIPVDGLYKKDFTTAEEAAQIQNPRSKAGAVTSYGIHIKSDIPVTAYYMVNHTDSRDIYTLKGSNALGTSFYVPMQHDQYCPTTYTGGYDQVDIVAAEDNTEVTVIPKCTIWKDGTSTSAPANTPYIKTLNKGETLKIMEYTQTGGTLAGSSITSTKPIAVSVTEDLVCGDTSGDQIVPTANLGTRYVVAKGYMTTVASERIYLVGTAAGTIVTINNGSGTNITKNLGAGTCEVYSFSQYSSANAIYIEATEPIYVFQRTGYNEAGSALLPSMYSISQNKASFYQVDAKHGKGVLIFRTGSEAGFKISYGGATSSLPITPIDVPGVTEWKCARFDLPVAANNKVVTIFNTQGIFSFGYIAANSSANNMSSYGYMTAFGDFKFPEITYKCVDEPVTLTAGYAKNYRWWKGRAAETGNPTIGTGSSYTVPADEDGYYSVEIDMDPRKIVVETYVKNDILNLTTTIPEYIKVNDNAPFSATATRLEGKTFEWAFTDATPATATGSNVSNIKWANTGSKTVTLTVKYTELGCSDDITTKTVYVYDIQDDYASATINKAVTVDVLANDKFPTLTSAVSSVATLPNHGSATISDNKIVYTPTSNFIGYDSLQYEVTYGTHKAYAWLRLSVAEDPDNISDAECFGDPPGANFSFKLLSSSPAAQSVNNYNIPLVGDIDNDGYTEIIVGKTSNLGVSTNQLYIFKFKDNKIELQQTLTTPYFNNVANPYSIAKVDGNDYAAIFICTDDVKNSAAGDKRKLIKYVYNPDTKLYEEFKVSSAVKRGTYSTLSAKEMAQPMIVDFNGDGIPEVVTYDKVFNARTMELLADGDLLKNADKTDNTATGFGFGGHMNNNQPLQGASIMAVGDMNGDGVPEVIGGNCVYKVDITNPNGTMGNTFTLWSKCSKIGPNGETHNEAVDGATAIADMDGDGLLDIIVTNGRYRNPSGAGGLYVWNPRTQKVIHTDIINNLPIYSANAYGVSVAFIGDIDNADSKNQPEICFTGNMKSYAYQYNPETKRLTQKWVINTNDNSGATTMVMFDFNQDRNNELVYRDQTHLRILRGIDGDNMRDPIGCTSGTAIEYPVVADINGDGAAEIIVTGGTQLYVYASDPAGMWAPARKVWNQFAYNSVNINEDLTVPKVQFNPAATLTGGSCGDIRPYNGYLLQQTTLNKYGCPIFLLPNLNFNGEPSYSYHTKGDSLLINVKFKNDGDAAIGPPVHVSVYKDAVSTANFIATANKNIMVLPNQTGECTIKVENLSSFKPYDKLVVRLNDNGSGTPVQNECDYDGNNGFKPQNQMLIAINDTLHILTNDIDKLADVLANDALQTCSVESIGLDFVAGKSPAKGSATISDKKVKYTPTSGYVGVDSLQYQIICGDDMATAELFIITQGLLKIEVVADASEPGSKGKCKVGFTAPNAKFHRPLKISYEIAGGLAVHLTDYSDTLIGTVNLPQDINSVEFDIITPINNFKVEGNSRTVQITITGVEIL